MIFNFQSWIQSWIHDCPWLEDHTFQEVRAEQTSCWNKLLPAPPMSEMHLAGQCHAFFQDALHPICQISLNTPVRIIHVNFARGWQVLSPLLRKTSEGDASCDLGNHALHPPCANLFFILILSASKPTPKKKTQSWTYKGILFLWVLACSLKLQLFASSCVRKLWNTFLTLPISEQL